MINLHGLLKLDEGIVYLQGGSHQKQTKRDSQFLFAGTESLVGWQTDGLPFCVKEGYQARDVEVQPAPGGM